MEIYQSPNTEIFINQEAYLYFSGTSYLGVSTHHKFQKNVSESIQKWGTSYGSSRNANLKLAIYNNAELFLSGFLEKEAAVTVSSGTLAGQFALKALEKKVDTFFFMPKTHPAIMPSNAKPVFVNGTLNPHVLEQKSTHICIVTDAIAALETNPFSFEFLKQISTTTKITLLIDESHSLGVLGKDGNGISNQLPKLEHVECVVVSSLGKAYGVNGGVISGKSTFINSIKEDARFIGSAGMSPAFLDCFIHSQNFYKKQRRKLQENCKYLFNALSNYKNINISKIYPVFFFDDEHIADYLFSKKIIITNFYYPPSAKKMNRIVLNANHTKKQLDILSNELSLFQKNKYLYK